MSTLCDDALMMTPTLNLALSVLIRAVWKALGFLNVAPWKGTAMYVCTGCVHKCIRVCQSFMSFREAIIIVRT